MSGGVEDERGVSHFFRATTGKNLNDEKKVFSSPFSFSLSPFPSILQPFTEERWNQKLTMAPRKQNIRFASFFQRSLFRFSGRPSAFFKVGAFTTERRRVFKSFFRIFSSFHASFSSFSPFIIFILIFFTFIFSLFSFYEGS